MQMARTFKYVDLCGLPIGRNRLHAPATSVDLPRILGRNQDNEGQEAAITDEIIGVFRDSQLLGARVCTTPKGQKSTQMLPAL